MTQKWPGLFLLTSCPSSIPMVSLVRTRRILIWPDHQENAVAPCCGWEEQAIHRPTDKGKGGQPQEAPVDNIHCQALWEGQKREINYCLMKKTQRNSSCKNEAKEI